MALYEQIDETTPSNTDFIQTEVSPTNAVYVCRLSDMDDPSSSSGHIVRYRYRKDGDGDQIDLIVQLIEGYTNEGSPGTTIHEETHTDIDGSGWVAGSFTLDGTEADAISDYTDLFLRFVANAPSPSSGSSDTINSSQTWTSPSGDTTATIECWGQGGQGGQGDSGSATGGGGGGGGAYYRVEDYPLESSHGYPISIDTAFTTFSDDSGTVCSAEAGSNGANGDTGGAGGASGISGSGDDGNQGGSGETGGGSGQGGGGGSSAGYSGATLPGNDGAAGVGGAAPTDGGAGGDGGDTSPGSGANGSTPGGGGGGGGADGVNPSGGGGLGGDGQVRITWGGANRRCMISWAQMEVPAA